MTNLTRFLGLLLIALLCAGCDGAETDADPAPVEDDDSDTEANSDDADEIPPELRRETAEDLHTLRERIGRHGDHSSFVMGMMVTNSVMYENKDDDFTIFVPNDEALRQYLESNDMEDIFQADNHDKARALLYRHVLSGNLLAEDFESGTVETIDGVEVPIEIDGDEIRYGGVAVTTTDHRAKNGVFHLIEDVVTLDD